MKITATVRNSAAEHDVVVSSAGDRRKLPVPPKQGGRGSAVNGGELLMLALATCYCNDLYREAERRKIELHSVEVEASAEFDGVGLAASNVRYRARVRSGEPKQRLELLLRETDAVAEIQNTIRAAVPVALVSWESMD